MATYNFRAGGAAGLALLVVTTLIGMSTAAQAKTLYPAHVNSQSVVTLNRSGPYKAGSHLLVAESVHVQTGARRLSGALRLTVVKPDGVAHHFTRSYEGGQITRKISRSRPGRYEVTLSFIPQEGSIFRASTATKTFHVKAAKKKHRKKK